MKPKPQRHRIDGLKQANWHNLDDHTAPVWIEPVDLAARLHVPVNTIRSWARRGRITSACCLQTGRLLVDLNSVNDRLTARRDQAA